MLPQYSRIRRPVLSAAEGNRRKFRTGASQVRLGVCELKQWQLEPANGCPPDADRRSFLIWMESGRSREPVSGWLRGRVSRHRTGDARLRTRSHATCAQTFIYIRNW